MKKRVLTGLAALTLLDISAQAAQADGWSGPYIGGHAGYRWGDAELTAPAFSFPDGVGGIFNVPARNEEFSLDDGIIGGHIGYNVLLGTSWLIGIEGDLTSGSGNDSSQSRFRSSDGLTALRTSDVDLDWQSTIRLRLGIVNGQWLFYAAGGVAFLDVAWSDTITVSGAGASATATVGKSDVVTGWTIGAGGAVQIDPNWIVRLEYLYEDFGDMNVPLAITSQTGELDITAQKLRVGITFKFGE